MEAKDLAAADQRARRPRRRAALAAAAVAFALAGAGPAAASNHVPRDFWGVVPIANLSGAEIEQMGAGNVGSVRQLTLWPAIEPRRGEFDWRYTDFLVATTASHGIEVLPFLYGTPDWVPGIKCQGLSPELCLRVPPVPRKARAAWAGFLRAIVGRYGSQGSFWSDTSDEYDPPYRPITKWQIWNEPSSQTYYQPQPKAKGYAKLVKLSHDAIAQVDPAAQIVLAGVFTAPEGGPRYRIAPYMKAFFRVRGVGKHFDIAAVHPYARTIQGLRKQIQNVRDVMRRNRAANRSLWITELGWSSDPPSSAGPLLVGDQGQKALLEQAFEMLAAQRAAWKLAGVSWYLWRDPGHGYANCTFCAGAGLLRPDGTSKPAWHSFVAITGGDPEPPPPPTPEPPPPLPDPLPILP
jgi:polysaccharide biosynthesis protein PslG